MPNKDYQKTIKKIQLRLIADHFQNKYQSNKLNRYLDPSFAKQNEFIKDRSRFITAQCSRRAGKSNGLAAKLLYTLETHPGAFCPYIALTRESARNIMWPVLLEIDDKLKLGCNFTESNLTVTHPNGARIQLFGADMKNFIRRLKGIKTPGAAIDEAQDFGGHLQSLVDDVLTPTLTDYHDSWLAIAGTPGPVPLGYFYEITAERKYGFSFHSWTLLDNPFLPQAAEFIKDLKIKRQWDETNPTLQREWYNNWVLDTNSLLVRYTPELNDYSELPPGKWSYILGVDLGIKDSDALALLAWSESTPNIYLVEEQLTAGQGVTELASQIESFRAKYEIHSLPTDEGALGKKIAEELRRRFGIPLKAADKTRKMENVTLLNDYLRMGRFKAKRNSRFVQDSYRVQIDWDRTTPDRVVVKDSFHSDIIDAVLYAFKESPAFTYTPTIEKPKAGTPAWYEQQVSEMEQAAEEYFTAQEQALTDGL